MNKIEITTRYVNASWEVKCKVSDTSDADFPREIFLWTLASDGALDSFQAIGHIDQVSKYKLYDPNRTSNFGIHLVRHEESVQRVSSEEDRDKVITVLKSAFDQLLGGYELNRTPITEIYP